MAEKPSAYQDVDQCVDDVISHVGKSIVLGIPLGLGKPNQFVNALYRRAKADSGISLRILTALTLELPTWSSELERRFLEPFVKRVFGGYVPLDYATDLRKGKLPDNIQVTEFFMKPGGFLGIQKAQQNYISCNYTHAYRDILDSGINVTAQMVSKAESNGKTLYSMSCNPEVALDLVPSMRQRERDGKPIAIIGQVNAKLPFMYGDAVVEPDQFDMVVDHPDYYTTLFGAPKMSVTTADYMIGVHASVLIKDGGTLQIGIGSLGDALCYGLQLRQTRSQDYNRLLDKGIRQKFGDLIATAGGTEPFEKGLFGSTEMLVDGYLHLMKHGIINRQVVDNIPLQRLLNQGKIGDRIQPDILDLLIAERAVRPRLTADDVAFLKHYGIFRSDVTLEGDTLVRGPARVSADLLDPQARMQINQNCLGDTLKNGALIHAGFFLGPAGFYRTLNEMSADERRRIFMTSVLNVNQLYEGGYASEELKTLQRKDARFVNAALMVTLSGAVVSDGLANGQVVSGVGGQYNFVSMAHALPGARSILMAKSTRAKGKDVSSNVVWNYGHMTIPRHLRDIIVTEYGVADLRGKSDKEIIAALLNIADSRFQEELLQQARDAGKISNSYRIPDRFKNNYPERLEDDLAAFKARDLFPPFPFGTDFTPEELVIGKSLRKLKEKLAAQTIPVPFPGIADVKKIVSVPAAAQPYLRRMNLHEPENAKEVMMQKLLVYALAAEGAI